MRKVKTPIQPLHRRLKPKVPEPVPDQKDFASDPNPFQSAWVGRPMTGEELLAHEAKAAATAKAAFDASASGILSEASGIVNGVRSDTHGPVERAFQSIAVMWDAYLCARRGGKSAQVLDQDVAHMMVLLKMMRSQTGQPLRDHWVDMGGYAGIAGELATQRDG